MHVCVPWLGWLLSPTRKIIDRIKQGDREHRGKTLRKWSLYFFWFEAGSSVLLAILLAEAPSNNATMFSMIAIAYAWSRINEIAYAFYTDSLTSSKQSDLTSSERIRMAMRSYFGLAFNFALLYYFIPVTGLFKDSLGSFFEAFYFSGVTLATLGYGDVLPKHWLCRLLSLYEVFAGILLVAVAIATYIGGSGESDASVAESVAAPDPHR
ncbi:potassium channel family protein [Fimbriiglobus ruber]|uniref:potassium channel family protein n=1 Tax=Fimbriiglobus ruber TaxID=1908690 RepID=UPI000B4B22CD|nr:potassium channel family protein [Fimbriiglobus ruber]